MYQLKYFILLFFLAPIFSTPSYSNDLSDPLALTIPLNNWSSQRVLSYVVVKLIQRLGVNVKYQNITVADQWGALRKGIVHIQIEVWQQSMSEDFNKMLNKNYIIDLGSHSAIVREEWWYPEYVEKECSGLPHWSALNECAHLFSTPSLQKGIFHTGRWDYHDADLIRSLDLNFTIKRSSNEKGLWDELKLSVANKRPLILLNWSPNWTDVRMKGKFIEFPLYSPECENDPSWGINKDLVYDCGNIKTGWLKKAAWTGLKDTWPCVYSLMQQIDLSHEMIANASALVVIDGYSEEEAADKWIDKYHENIKSWLDIQCHSNKTSK
ncbi:MAG: glycine betaine/proline transport system substrate-binding protein [Alteromonadaceae bacterium]|jgi:glycine betaine/proline transport system substrate-binding protein